ncbi:putative anti-sigma regulatory factor, serine/threonine protein kinase [metagenome]|uniref:Putative anti-sigma regulatory factor, serine/threonine protein kinase n=1 Tax=metagenome TaxID=256318 RepID=A0A2P2C198_9ZZZZ
MQPVNGDYHLAGLAVPEGLDDLHDLLENVRASHPDLLAEDLLLFETAVVEIAGNVVEHGRPPGEVSWTFRMDVRPDRLIGKLSDSGQAYAAESATFEMPGELAETGRGLALAQLALDELTYERADGANHWIMVRNRRSA